MSAGTPGTGPVDYRPRDAEALLAAMMAVARERLPEWTSAGDETDFGTVVLEAFAHVGDILGFYVDAAAAESFLVTARTRRSVIEHLRLIGYELATATPARAELVVDPLDEELVVPSGTAFTTASRPGVPTVRFEYVGAEDLVLSPGETADASLRTIPVQEGRFVAKEIVGRSTGSPYQRFRLLAPGVLLRPLGSAPRTLPDLTVETAIGEQSATVWTRGETLAFPGPDPHAVVVEIDADGRAEVVFGRTVPPEGAVVRATYRVGGGEHGNVAVGAITVVDGNPFPGRKITMSNPEPARGGAGPETSEHAVATGPLLFRSLGRAVTTADHATLAAQVSGVGKVRARPSDDRTVTLHVAQAGGGELSPEIRADVLAYLEDRRLVGTRVEVEDVEYVPVFVGVHVDAEPRRPAGYLEGLARAAVQELLAFDRVEFETPFYLSKIYEAIEAIDGVAGLVVGEFARPGFDQAQTLATGRLRVEGQELFRLPTVEDLACWRPDTAAAYVGGVRVTVAGGSP